MDVLSFNEEKKIDDQLTIDDDEEDDDGNSTTHNGRIERLEHLVGLLCADLIQVKEQQVRYQKQVLGLQADLVAAESAREQAELAMEEILLQDHELLLVLNGKQQQQQQQQQQREEQAPVPNHVRLHSFGRSSSTTKKDPDVIDVTRYEDDSSEENEIGSTKEDGRLVPNMCNNNNNNNMMQLWDDISQAVHQLSLDIIEQRDAFEFVWTKFQLEHHPRMTILEAHGTKQSNALTAMAIEWDEKLTEFHHQLQQGKEEFVSERTVNTTIHTELTNQVQQLSTQLNKLQGSVQTHVDYNRRMNGKRLVWKREQEVKIQQLQTMIQHLTTQVIQQQQQQERESKQSIELQTATTTPPTTNHDCYDTTMTVLEATSTPRQIVDERKTVPDKSIDVITSVNDSNTGGTVNEHANNGGNNNEPTIERLVDDISLNMTDNKNHHRDNVEQTVSGIQHCQSF